MEGLSISSDLICKIENIHQKYLTNTGKRPAFLIIWKPYFTALKHQCAAFYGELDIMSKPTGSQFYKGMMVVQVDRDTIEFGE